MRSQTLEAGSFQGATRPTLLVVSDVPAEVDQVLCVDARPLLPGANVLQVG